MIDDQRQYKKCHSANGKSFHHHSYRPITKEGVMINICSVCQNPMPEDMYQGFKGRGKLKGLGNVNEHGNRVKTDILIDTIYKYHDIAAEILVDREHGAKKYLAKTSFKLTKDTKTIEGVTYFDT